MLLSTISNFEQRVYSRHLDWRIQNTKFSGATGAPAKGGYCRIVSGLLACEPSIPLKYHIGLAIIYTLQSIM